MKTKPMTITQALVRDHRAASSDLARGLSNPRTLPTIYPKVADEIRRHSVAEEETLYQALGQIPAEQPTIATLEAGHKQIGALLDALDRTPYGAPTFLPTLRRVQILLAAHIHLEESQVFPFANRALPLPRRIALGQRYNLRMGAAPKRNVSIVASGRTPNPCGCEKKNPPARARRRWYHHMFGGVGALIR